MRSAAGSWWGGGEGASRGWSCRHRSRQEDLGGRDRLELLGQWGLETGGIILWEGHPLARSSEGDPLAREEVSVTFPLLFPTLQRSRTFSEAPAGVCLLCLWCDPLRTRCDGSSVCGTSQGTWPLCPGRESLMPVVQVDIFLCL